MRSIGKTDTGLVRKLNEDSYLCHENTKFGLYIVADGMGGHNAGEVASHMAVQEIQGYISQKSETIQNERENIPTLIKEALLYANNKIYKKSILSSECTGMGTTVSLALTVENALYIGHVGDSRAYLLRDSTISKLTEDHSLVAELVKSGTILPEEAKTHPQKNIITRALGTEYNVEVDLNHCDIQEGDYIILCSDGLSNLLEEEEMIKIVTSTPQLDAACDALIEEAKQKGGFDNITVVLVQVSKGGEADDR